MSRWLLPLLLVPPLTLACDPHRPAQGGTAALAANHRRAGRTEVYLPDGYGDVVGRVAARWDQPVTLRPLRDLSPGGEGGESHLPRVVVGPPDAPQVQRLMKTLDLDWEIDGRSWHLLGPRRLPLRDTVLVIVWEDPDRPGLPITLVVGADAWRVRQILGRVAPGYRPQLRVYVEGELQRFARLGRSGVLRPSSLEDRRPLRLRKPGRYGESTLGGGGVEGVEGNVIATAPRALAPQVLESYVADLEAAWGRLAWAGVERPAELMLVAETHLDGFAHDLPPRTLARHDRAENRLTALLGKGLAGDGGRALGRSLLLAKLGPPAPDHIWMEDAAALDAADRFFGRDLEAWCAHLAGIRPWTVEELLADDALERFSPLAVEPLRALLFRTLREGAGAGVDPASLWGGRSDHARWSGLFAQRLEGLKEAHRTALEARRAELLARCLSGSWGGVVLDAPLTGGGGGAGSAAGLGSEAMAEALEHAAALGARAVLVSCHLSTADGGWGGAGGLGRRSDGAPLAPPGVVTTLEGDAAVVATLAAARAAGLRTALLPRLLATASGVLDGNRVLASRETWREHFHARQRALLHAALLAELGGAELLLVGSGTPEAARTRWTNPWGENEVQSVARQEKVAGWTACLATARAAFTGGLTYGADSPDKVDWFGLWDRLDLILVHLDPLVGAEGGPAPEELYDRRLGRLLDQVRPLGEDLERPLAISVGFRSVRRAALGSRAPGGPTDDGEQARLMAALARVLAARAEEGRTPAGVLVRGWSADPSAASDPRGSGVRGKAAEQILPRLFRALEP